MNMGFFLPLSELHFCKMVTVDLCLSGALVTKKAFGQSAALAPDS